MLRSEFTSSLTLARSHRYQIRRPRKSLAPSVDVVPHRESPAMLSTPPQSAASRVVTRCHCHKRRRRRRSPTPHWTLQSNTRRHGPLRAVKRPPCDDPWSPSEKRLPQRELRNPLLACHTVELTTPDEAAADRGKSRVSAVSRAMPSRRVRRQKRHHRSSKNWTGFHPETTCRRVVSPKWRPNGEERRQGRRRHSTRRTLARTFTWSIQAQSCTRITPQPTPQPRQPHQSAATTAPLKPHLWPLFTHGHRRRA
jgi:hypothetical protein